MEPLSKPATPLNYPTAFSAILDPDEKVLWAGQPRQGVFFRASDALVIPFSLMWGGFAIFWEVMVLTSMRRGKNTPLLVQIVFPLWGIPFVVVGLYMIFGRFFVDAWRRRRTWYGVTDRRALIVSAGRSRKLTSFDLRTIGEVNFQEHPDGTGTLTFGPVIAGLPLRSLQWKGMPPNAFDHTPDARQAYAIVRQVQHASAKVGS